MGCLKKKRRRPNTIKNKYRDFFDGPVTEIPCSQCQGPGFYPWSGNWIPHATTKIHMSQLKNLNAATKTEDPAMPQLRPGAVK